MISIALAVSGLVFVEGLLSWLGLMPSSLAVGPRPFTEWWSVSWALGLQIAFGLSIAVLVIIGIVTAVLGAISWRRGVVTMVADAPAYGPAQVAAAAEARRDHSVTLWLFLVYVLTAVAVAVGFAIVNAVLAGASAASVPEVVISVATGLGTAAVLVLIYYYGSKHLVGLLHSLSSTAGRASLERGRSRMLAGAVVGLGAALAPISWVFDVVAIVSLAIILAGVGDLVRAYAMWLAGDRISRPPGSGVVASPA